MAKIGLFYCGGRGAFRDANNKGGELLRRLQGGMGYSSA
jgi:hypothetical protein